MSGASHGAKAFVLGLDGVPWRLIERWAGDGTLPNFARVLEEGAAGPLESTTPATTPLAWPSIATGVRPDKHGIYGFQRLASDYTHRMYTGSDVTRTRVWDVLAPAVVANVPMTYPAREIDGTMVAGMMTPAVGEGFTHPPDLRAEIAAEIPDYRIGLDWGEYDGPTPEFLRDLEVVVEGRRALMRLLMERTDWRLFFFVYTAPDRLQHLVWDEDVLREHYRTLDDVLGEVMAHAAERDATLYVVSDHGFGPISTFVAVNRLLAEEGFLAPKGSSGSRGLLARLGVTKAAVRSALEAVGVSESTVVDRLPRPVTDGVAARIPGDHALYDVDFGATRAFAHGPGTVYVNDTDRFDRGTVDPAEVPRVKREVASALGGLTDPETGAGVLEVHDGEDLFPTDPRAPDLVTKGRAGYEVTTALSESVRSGTGAKSASHRSEGVFLAWGPDVRAGAVTEEATVFDVAPTVLHGAGEPVPEDADGRVLAEIFAPGSAPARADVRTAAYGSESAREVDADLDGVEERLRGLGYMQ